LCRGHWVPCNNQSWSGSQSPHFSGLLLLFECSFEVLLHRHQDHMEVGIWHPIKTNNIFKQIKFTTNDENESHSFNNFFIHY
jgi:hypothetical protein